MVRKKTSSTTMSSPSEDVERRFQEMEAKMEAMRAEILDPIRNPTTASNSNTGNGGGGSNPGNANGGPGIVSSATQNESERRHRKVELPLFSGEDAPGWIGKMERYFKFRQLPEEDKLDAALMAMEGEALAWMQWWETSTLEPNWREFKNAMLRRFQPTVVSNVVEVMLGLKQEGTVREFRKSFEALSGHLKIQDPELILGMFSNGLKEEIRAEVRLQRPKDLAEMMDVALLAEEKLGLGKSGANLGSKNQSYNKNGGFRNWKTEPGSNVFKYLASLGIEDYNTDSCSTCYV